MCWIQLKNGDLSEIISIWNGTTFQSKKINRNYTHSIASLVELDNNRLGTVSQHSYIKLFNLKIFEFGEVIKIKRGIRYLIQLNDKRLTIAYYENNINIYELFKQI